MLRFPSFALVFRCFLLGLVSLLLVTACTSDSPIPDPVVIDTGLDAGQQWGEAGKASGQAAELITKDVSVKDIRRFHGLFGELCENPFFAVALSEKVSPEDLVKFTEKVTTYKNSWFGGLDGELADRVISELGSVVVLSIGGSNTSSDSQRSFDSAKNKLKTSKGGVADLVDSNLSGWRKTANSYRVLGELFTRAGEQYPGLVLGEKFFSSGFATDLIGWDFKHRNQPSGFDLVQGMLSLMDQPSSSVDEGFYDAVQGFLVSTTPFEISDVRKRKPALDISGPMNITRYLTSFRHPNMADKGNALGRVLAQTAFRFNPPISSQDRDKNSAVIAGNFLLGYQEGLNIEQKPYKGENRFGFNHAGLVVIDTGLDTGQEWSQAGEASEQAAELLTKSADSDEDIARIKLSSEPELGNRILVGSEFWKRCFLRRASLLISHLMIQ